MPERMPRLDGPSAAMPDAQRRAALRRLQAARQAGVIGAGLYLSLISHLVAEHAPRSFWAQWWGQRPRKDGESRTQR